MARTRRVSDSSVIAAPAAAIFAVLADPRRHPDIDGSGMLRGSIFGPSPLSRHSRFGMRMRWGAIPYKITNTVVEFEEDRCIAWRHFARHVWRYELAPVEGGTLVTESFDWSTAPARLLIDVSRFPRNNLRAITATLRRLERLVTKEEPDAD